MGVADGVGGWAETRGVNPADYARALMRAAEQTALQMEGLPEWKGRIDPGLILKRAFEFAKRQNIIGSSTACIVVVQEEPDPQQQGQQQLVLRAANLGDSGFLVLRGSDVVCRSKAQQHQFNMPFQLGTDSGDTPELAERVSFPLQLGDLIIIGSDGLFDNLFDSQIVQIATDFTKKPRPAARQPVKEGHSSWHHWDLHAGALAQQIAGAARLAAQNTRGQSPFSQEALRHGFVYPGGKLDDITVLVGRIVDKAENANGVAAAAATSKL